MFDLFKKQEKPSEPQWPEFKQLSAQYLPEERTILAVTGEGKAVDRLHRADRLAGGGRT